MTDHPILFSAPMVRAILDGRKTMTRRVLPASHPKFRQYNVLNPSGITDPAEGVWYWDGVHDRVGASLRLRWIPGDTLWVREAWQYYDWTEDGMPFIRYRSDKDTMLRECPEEWAERVEREWIKLSDPENTANHHGRARDWSWRPSIHMPRWASRITLAVEAVRVERLQDISEGDAIAEGCFFTDYGRWCFHQGGPPCDPGDCPAPDEHHPQRDGWMWDATTSTEECLGSARSAFANLWEKINGPDAWNANPWVSVTTFRRVEA